MCGRFANGLERREYVAALQRQLPDDVEQDVQLGDDDYVPSYNVAPQTRSPVVRRADSGDGVVIDSMRWGVPSDALRSDTPSHPVINSRDDSILQPRSVWGKAIRTQRCVVFCQGFYEWEKKHIQGMKPEQAKRVPYFMGMQGEGAGRPAPDGSSRQLMPLAALYMTVEDPKDKRPAQLFTIVTTQANKQLDFMHDRMPVILPTKEAIAAWLSVRNRDISDEELAPLLKPFQGTLDCYKVPPEVNRVGKSSPEMIQPLSSRKDGIEAMFANAKQRTQPEVKQEAKLEDRPPAEAKHENGRHAEVEQENHPHADVEQGDRAHVEVKHEERVTPKAETDAASAQKHARIPSPSPHKRIKTEKRKEAPPDNASIVSFMKKE